MIETFLREDGSYRIVWDREQAAICDGVDDPRALGGFYGMAPPGIDEQHTINLRTSAYALIALLKLEGQELGPYHSIGDRNEDWRR